MPKLRVMISQNDLSKLNKGESVDIGKFAGMDLCTLDVEPKKDEKAKLYIEKEGIRFENENGKNIYFYSDISKITNANNGDITFDGAIYCVYNKNKWIKAIVADDNA